MATAEARASKAGDLAEALRAADPRVVLVEPRVLRRVVRGMLGLGPSPWQHVRLRGGIAVEGPVVLRFAERDEVGLSPGDEAPETMILLARPEAGEAGSREQVLIRYWRDLYHARVHLAFDGRVDRFPSGGGWLAERIARIGRAEFAEARAVLVEDGYLSLPADDRSTYVELAAAYLELLQFHPELLPHTFPAIRDHEAVRRLLAADVDPDALLEATRPLGAPPRPALPIEAEPAVVDDDDQADEADTEATAAAARRRATRLRAGADAASARGNNVRAAILRVRAERVIAGRSRAVHRGGTYKEFDKLARRLRGVVGFDAEEAGRWRSVLSAFLDRAARGRWSREARMLYDLQKACSDGERPLYAVDLLRCVGTLGRLPLRRPLPDQREVLVLKHLRAAWRRVRDLRGPEPSRTRLEELLARAIARKEAALKVLFRDRIAATLERVGLTPGNLPERAARRKLVEELLDLIVERGFLRIGDLRDAISRNQVKLRDLSGPGEFLRGDPLLRADDALSREIDGVHHRGEIYLRALQRASSLAFGTRLGRLFSRYVGLPFGGAFIILEGLQHIAAPIVHAFGGVEPHLFYTGSHLAVGVLLIGLINSRRFRSAAYQVVRGVGRAIRAVGYDVPAWLLDLPLVRTIVSSRTFLLAWNWLGKPGLLLLLLSPLVRVLLDDYHVSGGIGRAIQWALLVPLALLVNSRSGRDFEEIAADGAGRLGQRVWRDLIPNVFRGVMDFFNAALEALERLLYGVDEWLRFRGGDGRASLAAKAVLGLVWAVVAYLARIYVNLLIEPQVNPIKHFPVVTVSHKIILPMSKTILTVLVTPLLPLGTGPAYAIAGATIFLLPGVFGFLAWELKENWRLYAANRPPALGPVAIGHHGETMSRFLRRGFHSGTVPKLFARLRRADRLAELGRGPAAAQKRAEAIHLVERAVRHFVERGVGYLLEESRSLGPNRPTIAAVEVATNRIVVEVRDRGDARDPARLAFEESNRTLRATLEEPGWLAGLDDEPRRVLTTALAGLYATSDVDRAAHGESPDDLDARPCRLRWATWVTAWEDDAAGRGHPSIVPEGCRLIPARASADATSPGSATTRR